MTHIVAVTPQKPAKKFWTRFTSYDFAAKIPLPCLDEDDDIITFQ